MKRILDTADASRCELCFDVIIPDSEQIVLGFIDPKRRRRQQFMQFHVKCYELVRKEEASFNA